VNLEVGLKVFGGLVLISGKLAMNVIQCPGGKDFARSDRQSTGAKLNTTGIAQGASFDDVDRFFHALANYLPI